MKYAIGETDRRRAIQEAYNHEHGITPASIVKSIDEVLEQRLRAGLCDGRGRRARDCSAPRPSSTAHVADLRTQMKAAAANLEFEKAASLRDRIKQLRSRDLGLVGSQG